MSRTTGSQWGAHLCALVVVLVLLAGSVTSAFGQTRPDAAALFAQLIKSDPGIAANVDGSRTVAYTTSTDPESLLGRPGQYVSKVGFVDSRVAPAGGSLEVFRTSADVAARVAYLQRGGQAHPKEYLYTGGTVLLRLPGNLPPEAAEAYNAALRNALSTM
jgi:hypothetical protein